MFTERIMYHRLRIKVCGVTTIEDAHSAGLLGADAVGLNFWDGSKRYVTPTTAQAILRELPPFVEPVALFVNQPLRNIFPALNALGRIRTFQWHGTQRELCDTYPFQMIMAFPVRDRASLTEVTRYLDTARSAGKAPSAVLVDAHVPGVHGGSG